MPSPETRDLIWWVLSVTLAVLTLLGLIGRYVVWPWIQSQLVQPLAETRHQVFVNGGTSETPTVPDHIAALAVEVRSSHAEIKRDIGGIRQEIREERTERREADAELRRGADRLERAIETHARAQAAVWPAIEAVAKATPPADD